MTNASANSIQRQNAIAILAFVLLALSVILIVYGSTQPANITVGAKYGSDSQVNVFWFVGVVLAAAHVSCWFMWLYQRHPRGKAAN